MFRPGLFILLLILSGLCGASAARAAVAFPTNATWRYFKGTTEASAPDGTAWRAVDFDDSAWASGAAPFFYGEALSGTLLGDMQGLYSSVFLRQKFVLTNAAEFGTATLALACDDGCIVWINGVEVARYNVPAGAVPFGGLALAAVPEPVPYTNLSLVAPLASLVNGTNAIAVQVFNAALNSDDILFNATLSGGPDTNAPVALAIFPAAGAAVHSLTTVDVTFSEPVVNVDAADLRVNGTPATNLAVLSPSQFRFQFPQPPTGSVTVTISSGHGIRDHAANPLDNMLWFYTLNPNLPPASVRISEFLAANNNSVTDEDGERNDWIELHNYGAGSVNLNGWFLTDEESTPAKWRFPAVTLLAGKYRLVWASGKNRTNSATPLHTNFRLDSGGGYLGLFDAETNLVHAWTNYPSQFPDISYGFLSNSFGYFGTPTPATNNATQFAGRVDAPGFSHKRGFYETNFSLVLTSETAGASIYFTTNGTQPSPTNGVLYTAPITVTNTRVFRAAAFKTNLLSSDTRTHTLLFTRDIIRQSPTGTAPPGWPATWGANVVDYGMDPNVVNDGRYSGVIQTNLRKLPSLCLVMPLADLFNASTGIYANPGSDGLAWERQTSLELIRGDNSDGFQSPAGLRIRGGFSRTTSNPKHSFRFIFREEFGAGKLRYPLFGPTGASSFDKVDLRTAQDNSWAFQGDPNGTFLADTFVRDTHGAMGRPYTRGDWYHLYINGVYWGVYNTEERPEGSYASSYFGGVPEDYDVVKVEAGVYDVVATEGTLDAWHRLWDAAVAGFAADADYEKIQGNNPDGTPNDAFEVLVDMDNLIDYMLLTIFSGNYDGPVYLDNFPNNFYAVRNRGTRDGFRFFTHDAELAIDNVNYDRTTTITVGDPLAGDDFYESNPQYVWQRLWANAEFRLRTADRAQQLFFNNGPFTPAACIARYAARTNELSPGLVGESARWGDAQREPPITQSNWINAVSGLINSYFPQRTGIVLQQLRNRGLYPAVSAPNFSQSGGAVPAAYPLVLSHTNASGTIWFTLDGSDPRLRGGNVSPRAQGYAAPVVINGPTVVRARVRNGAIWSALVAAVLYPPQDLSGLRVTEIMYDPPRFGLVDGDEVEFLELKNTGATQLDLTGLSFTSGINFTFTNNTRLAPGAFWLLVRNPAQFAVKYPGVAWHGVFTGNLADSGETITLATALSNLVFNVAYADAVPWPLAADGLGFSLVPSGVMPAQDSDPRHWRASANPGGSPGADDPPGTIPKVVVNELLSRPVLPGLDTVEIANPTAAPVDISGWFLTDDAGMPMKYRFAPDTVIPAGGFLTLDEVQFNPAPGTNNSFAFGLRGDGIFLFSGDANTNLTGHSHGFVFDGAAEGVSFGRHVNSAGEEQFPAQLATSFGAANTGPRPGPVVINEVHYHPAVEHDEFIELRNITVSPVALFDPAFPSNTWRINGADFSFPTNITLDPGGHAIVTVLTAAVFRAKYAIPAHIPVFGPMGGDLQDSGERLELQRPETPDTNGVVWITVDAVRYNDKAPWPSAADGEGASLQRLVSPDYGDEPTNWFASGITPGAPNAWSQPPFVAITSPVNGALLYVSNSMTLLVAASDADGFVTRVEYFNNGVKLGESANPPFGLVWTNPPAGTHMLTARARDNGLNFSESAPVVFTLRAMVFTNFPIVPAGSVWRFNDKGLNLGNTWIPPAYDDSGWSNGPAQLGFGDGDEATVVKSNRQFTTYFRRAFVNPAPAPLTAVTLRVLRDDGVIVWLNGGEVLRDNLPGGAIAYNTAASTSLAAPAENTFLQSNLAPGLILPGTNILSVEIHNRTATDNDIGFDLELLGTVLQPDPQVTLLAAGGQWLLRWPALAASSRIEETTNLAPPAAWTTVSNGVLSDGYWRSLSVTNPGAGHRFFRLRP